MNPPMTALAIVAAVLSVQEAHAACDDPHAVALEIEAQRDTALRLAIERHVAAELRSENIGVCAAPPSAVLATLSIRAPGPEQPLASIRVSRADAQPLERSLDVSGLPPEARALAIASAADELLRSALALAASAEPGASAAEPPAPVVATPRAELDVAPDAPTSSPEPSVPQARFELGLAGTAASIFGQRETLSVDLTARYWLTPRVALGAALGTAHRLSRPFGRGSVQPTRDLHATLGAGYALWRSSDGLGVVAQAGLELARVGFDEAIGGGGALTAEGYDYVNIVAVTASYRVPLDTSWWLLGRGGIEGRYRSGALGISVALNALVPIVPAESDWGDATTLDRVGAELGAGVWVAWGASE